MRGTVIMGQGRSRAKAIRLDYSFCKDHKLREAQARSRPDRRLGGGPNWSSSRSHNGWKNWNTIAGSFASIDSSYGPIVLTWDGPWKTSWKN